MDLAGIPLLDLPEGATALEAVVTIKVLDAESRVMLIERVSEGLSSWEALGMVTTLGDSIRQRLLGAHTDSD